MLLTRTKGQRDTLDVDWYLLDSEDHSSLEELRNMPQTYRKDSMKLLIRKVINSYLQVQRLLQPCRWVIHPTLLA